MKSYNTIDKVFKISSHFNLVAPVADEDGLDNDTTRNGTCEVDAPPNTNILVEFLYCVKKFYSASYSRASIISLYLLVLFYLFLLLLLLLLLLLF